MKPKPGSIKVPYLSPGLLLMTSHPNTHTHTHTHMYAHTHFIQNRDELRDKLAEEGGAPCIAISCPRAGLPIFQKSRRARGLDRDIRTQEESGPPGTSEMQQGADYSSRAGCPRQQEISRNLERGGFQLP